MAGKRPRQTLLCDSGGSLQLSKVSRGRFALCDFIVLVFRECNRAAAKQPRRLVLIELQTSSAYSYLFASQQSKMSLPSLTCSSCIKAKIFASCQLAATNIAPMHSHWNDICLPSNCDTVFRLLCLKMAFAAHRTILFGCHDICGSRKSSIDEKTQVKRFCSRVISRV